MIFLVENWIHLRNEYIYIINSFKYSSLSVAMSLAGLLLASQAGWKLLSMLLETLCKLSSSQNFISVTKIQ